MIFPLKVPDEKGLIKVVEMNEFSWGTDLGFSLLRLGGQQSYNFPGKKTKESAFMILDGKARISWLKKSEIFQRSNLINEKPAALHLPAGVTILIEALSEHVEMAVLSVQNEHHFDVTLYTPEMIIQDEISSGKSGDAAHRTIRTVLDDDIAPDSNMCFGEILNMAGRWSSYPPHYHPQPEIYHYRFFPVNGFGYSGYGDDVYRVQNEDTAVIKPDTTHSQVAAPGYTMYYLWAIPHLKNNRFTSTSRIYEEQHKWVLQDE